MAEGVVQLPADGTGKRLRTQEVTIGGVLVEQEVVTLADAAGTLISPALDATLPKLVGTWDYRAGASGTPRGFTGRVVGIAVHATVAGSLTINGGDSIPIPANSGIAVTPNAQLVSPALVFTGTDSFFVEFVS